MYKPGVVEPGTAVLEPRGQLDKDIYEAAAQIIGHDLVNDYPHRRFVLLCAARAEFENEALVGFDPERQWVEIARNAYVAAADRRKKEYFSLSHLLADTPSAVTWQREVYQATMQNLVITNTDRSPGTHWGPEFVDQVIRGEIQIRYV